MKAVIPAGGYATRLYPLTEFQPKHLLPVVGKPILAYVIEKIEKIDEVDEILIVTNDKFYPHFKNWLENFSSSKKIKLITDHTKSNSDRLGSLGDINFLLEEEQVDDDILIISGDNIFDFELLGMHKKFREVGESVISLYDVGTFDEARKFGVVEKDKDNKITGFIEKPDEPKSTLCSIGIYFYPKKVIGLLKDYLEAGHNKDAPGYFLEWLHNEISVYGYVFEKKEYDWFDIGDLAGYSSANRIWENKVEQ